MSEIPPPMPPLPSGKWNDVFEPYAREIGFFLKEWNELQEFFAALFAVILGMNDGGISRAVWYSISNDRLQRAMLTAAAKARFEPKSRMKLQDERDEAVQKERDRLAKNIWNEIEWLTRNADGLGQMRDGIAHSPVMINFSTSERAPEYIPRAFWGNPTAARLLGQPLLDIFKLHHKRAQILRAYTNAVSSHLSAPLKQALPQRPAWPPDPTKKKGAKESPKAHSKEQPPPPRSSRA